MTIVGSGILGITGHRIIGVPEGATTIRERHTITAGEEVAQKFQLLEGVPDINYGVTMEYQGQTEQIFGSDFSIIDNNWVYWGGSLGLNDPEQMLEDEEVVISFTRKE